MTGFTIKQRLWLTSAATIVLLLVMWAFVYSVVTTMAKKQGLIAEELEKAQLLQDSMAALQELNAPGNDVLANWDHIAERENLRKYREAYEAQERQLRSRLTHDAELRDGQQSVRADVHAMIQKATSVMDAVERKTAAEKAGNTV